jgi:HEAT repeat protein
VHRRWFPAIAVFMSVVAPVAAAEKPAGLAGEVAGQLGKELASEDDDVAVAAAKRLGELGASAPLIAALSVGLRPAVAAEALTALGKTKDARALPALVLYAGNINTAVRLAAVKGLGRLGDARSADVLLERLGDGQPQVRAAAAEALAARKEARAEARLLLLVARNDAGAAAPLGALLTPSAVPRLADLHGRIDDAVLATALGEFLKRPDVPDRLRIDVVRTIARLPGASATAALVEYLASVPEKDQRPSKEEAQRLLDERGDK